MLSPGDVVIMDNLSVHKRPAVHAAIKAALRDAVARSIDVITPQHRVNMFTAAGYETVQVKKCSGRVARASMSPAGEIARQSPGPGKLIQIPFSDFEISGGRPQAGGQCPICAVAPAQALGSSRAHRASSASIAAMRSAVLGWLISQAGMPRPPMPVSRSSLAKRDFCGPVPIPALTSSAEA